MAYSLEQFHQKDKVVFGPDMKSIPMVAFRPLEDPRIHEAIFATSKDADIFVNNHRAIAKTKIDSKGEVTVIPGQYERQGKWDWFVQYVVWEKKTDEELAAEAKAKADLKEAA
jgi:hypothetical protein